MYKHAYRRRHVALMAGAIAAVLGGWLAQQPRASAQGPLTAPDGKVHTNKTVFHLPIPIGEAERGNFREIVLYVKQDAGEWQRKEAALPAQKYFTYRAQQDGEYWFGIVTIDQTGTPNPRDVSRQTPGLMVKVDTKAPTIDLTPVPLPNNEIGLRCSIADSDFDPQSVRALLFTREQTWQPLSEVPGMSGVYRLPRQDLAGALQVRCTAADRAGNSNTKEVGTRDLLAQLWPQGVEPTSVAVAPTVPTAPIVPATLQEPVAPKTIPVVQTTPVVPLTQVAQQPMPPMPPSPPAPLPLAVPPTAVPLQPTPPSVNQMPVQPTAMPVSGPTLPTSGTTETVAHRPAFDNLSLTAARATPGYQLLRTKRVSMEYSIDRTGASGIGKVEVYMTTDNGRTWQRLCDDADKRTPVDFDLPSDGLYGLRLVITNGNGFGGTAPLPGDTPDAIMEVDTTPPSVQWLGSEIVTGNGQLELRWNASDKNLTGEPVTLSYATRKEGPWYVLKRGLKNEGTYRWQFPRNEGGQFYFRVEVVDLAGNVGKAESTEPRILDLTEPRGIVTGISGVTPRPTPMNGN